MYISRHLIQRFFNNNCTKEEAAAVVQFLKEHEDVLDSYLPKEEWDQINHLESLPKDEAEHMYNFIEKELFGIQYSKKVFAIVKKMNQKWTLAAACVLLFIASTIVYILPKKDDSTVFTSTNKKIPFVSNKKNTNTLFKWVTIENKSRQIKKYQLNDGSTVHLSPKASIQFTSQFVERNIFLNGEAYFQVTKNKLKPFTVFTGAISTTALGTSFSINAPNAASKKVHIKLYTGKVVVKAVQQQGIKNKDIFLLPGDEVVYNTLKMLANTNRFKESDNKYLATKKINAATESWSTDIQFEHTSLDEVLIKIQEIFAIKIIYDSSQVANINFTGSINKSNNIKNVLGVIAQMNGFSITEDKQGFILSKQK
ncbi:MAG: FecR family protein [Sphingobacteriia bacterium]|jgi:ferric-dicitrate binding protein FerR (iron transport regulator)